MKSRKASDFTGVRGSASRRLERLALRLRVPLHLHLDLTWRCPWRCEHCYLQDSPKHGAQELQTDEWVTLLHEAARLGALYLTLSGGDPMVRPDFEPILTAARSLKYSVKVKTTGWCLDASLATRFAQLGQVGVDISLHGATEVTHDRLVRRKGAFKRASRAIEMLTAASVPVKVTMCAMVANALEMHALQARCVQRGIQFSATTILFSTREGKRPSGELTETQQAEILAPRLKGYRPRAPRPKDPLCKAGISAWYVTPFGEVTPCVAWPMTIGNVRGGFGRVIASDSARGIAMMRQKDRRDCWHCDLKAFCVACPGESFIETRDPLCPSSLACRRARVYRMAYELNQP